MKPGVAKYLFKHEILQTRAGAVHEASIQHAAPPETPGKILAAAVQAFGSGRMPILKKHFMNIDLHRTNGSAGAAQGRRITQVLVIFLRIQVRRDHGTDRSAVGGPVSVSANVLVDGAGIEAGAATDAVKPFTHFRSLI